MKKLISWIVATGVAVLTVSSSYGVSQQWPKGFSPRRMEIRGTVLPAAGENSLPGIVTVTLRASGTGYEVTRMVKQDGSFEFGSVTRANYQLTVESSGRETTVMSLHESDFRGGTLRLNLSVGRSTETDPVLEGVKVIDARLAGVSPKARKELERAKKEGAAGNLEKALIHFKKAIDIDPEFAAAYDSLALLQLQMEQHEQAEASLLKSIELNEDGKTAQKTLGFIYVSHGRVKEAISPLTRAAELDPRDAETQALLGMAYYQMDEYAEAEGPLKSALAISPGFFRSSYLLGYVYLKLERYPEALETFYKFLETNKGLDSSDVEAIVAELEAALGQ